PAGAPDPGGGRPRRRRPGPPRPGARPRRRAPAGLERPGARLGGRGAGPRAPDGRVGHRARRPPPPAPGAPRRLAVTWARPRARPPERESLPGLPLAPRERWPPTAPIARGIVATPPGSAGRGHGRRRAPGGGAVPRRQPRHPERGGRPGDARGAPGRPG